MSQKASPTGSQPRDPAQRWSDVTCLGCGCLCDDLVVEQRAGGLALQGPDCALARGALERAQTLLSQLRQGPQASVNGQPVSAEEAIAAAGRRLADARGRSIAVECSARCTVETARAVVELADRLSATVETGMSAGRWLARQRAGWVTATWGEIAERADRIVLWDLNLASDGPYPRFAARFIDRPGRFQPSGRAARRVIGLATRLELPQLSRTCDAGFELPPDAVLHTLSELRAIVRGTLSPGRTSPVSMALWAELHQASYGVLLTGRVFEEHASGPEQEALARLVIDLNAQGRGRFVHCEIGEDNNRAGVEAVLGWQAGAVAPVDFQRGYPRFLPAEAELERRLGLGQVDLVLGVGPRARVAAGMARAREINPDLRWIQIGTDATVSEHDTVKPDVAIATQDPWLESGGTVVRSDGVSLPLTPLHCEMPAWPSPEEVIARILASWDSRGDLP